MIPLLTAYGYNRCRVTGCPVTLRFADAVEEILSAGPLAAIPPLALKPYI